MQGTIIENLSGKKLSVLVSFLIIGQIICFVIGGLIAPTPASSQIILGTPCKDIRVNGSEPGGGKWFYPRGKGACISVDTGRFDLDDHYLAHQVVYTFQMPLPNRQLDYSRWQQNLIGVLQLDIMYHSQMEIVPGTKITLDAKLAYRNKGDPDYAWKPYASSIEERSLNCTIDLKTDDYIYTCSVVPLFELGSLFHDYYLLNVRLPADTDRNINQGLGHVTDLWLTVILFFRFVPFLVVIFLWKQNYSTIYGSRDGVIRLWQCGESFRSLTMLLEIKVVGFVDSLAFTPDGKSLVAGIGRSTNWEDGGEYQRERIA